MNLGKKRWRVALLIAAGIALAVMAFHYAWNREPQYDGRPVSYWFKEFCYPMARPPYHDDDEAKADEALKRIGTNALPYLLEQAFNTNADSTLHKTLHKFFQEFPTSWRMPRFVDREDFWEGAPGAIRVINPSASVVVPLMQTELNQTNTLQFRQAIRILSRLTNDAGILLPYFTRALHDPDPQTQIHALGSLAGLGPKAAASVSDLMEVLQNLASTNLIRLEFEWTLANIGSNAAPAIPLLGDMFDKETNMFQRSAIAATLFRIDARQVQAFAFLTNNLTSREDRNITLAAWRLGVIGPNAKPAIPLLLDAFTTTNISVFNAVLNSLNSLGASNELILRKVRSNLGSQGDEVRTSAAELVLRNNKADQAAQNALISMITKHSEFEPRAIIALGKAGPSASVAIPAILSALDGTNVYSWAHVARALTNMGVTADKFLPKLEEKIRPDTTWERENDFQLHDIAAEILKFDPANRNAQLALVRLIRNDDYLGAGGAIGTLMRAKPLIPEVLPALQNLRKSENIKTRKLASDAIKQRETRDAVK